MRKSSHNLPCGRPVPKKADDPRDTATLLADMLERLESFTVEKKLNRSEARAKILETIIFEARHFTAIDLLRHLLKRHPVVGKATLYRNLPVLVESGIIREGPIDPDGQISYELAGVEHHDHIVCTDCRRIFEFHDRDIEKRQDAVSRKLSFEPRDHRHVIFASCEYLRKR